jgi:hypothetical protein
MRYEEWEAEMMPQIKGEAIWKFFGLSLYLLLMCPRGRLQICRFVDL